MSGYDPEFDLAGNVQRLGLAFRVISESVDLDGIVATVEMAHTIGAVLDPTKYRDALSRGDNAIAELAAALREPVRIWREKIGPKIAEASA